MEDSYRLSGDWGRVGLGVGVGPLATKGSPRNRGTVSSWALFHARGPGFLALGSCLDKAHAHATWKCPPSLVPTSTRALSSG